MYSAFSVRVIGDKGQSYHHQKEMRKQLWCGDSGRHKQDYHDHRLVYMGEDMRTLTEI